MPQHLFESSLLQKMNGRKKNTKAGRPVKGLPHTETSRVAAVPRTERSADPRKGCQGGPNGTLGGGTKGPDASQTSEASGTPVTHPKGENRRSSRARAGAGKEGGFWLEGVSKGPAGCHLQAAENTGMELSRVQIGEPPESGTTLDLRAQVMLP